MPCGGCGKNAKRRNIAVQNAGIKSRKQKARLRRVANIERPICPQCGSMLRPVPLVRNNTKLTLLTCVNKKCNYAKRG